MKIIFPKAGEPAAQPDPYILKTADGFYIYATGVNGVEAYYSESLLSGWRYIGTVLKERGMREFWAPCVIEKDGVYYMYYSSYSKDADDVHLQAVKAATATSPKGPFEYVKTVLPAFSIDPHVVANESGYYMFYSTNDYAAERCGTYIAVDKMTDMFTVEGKPVKAVVPTLDEEIFMKDRFEKGRHWHTIEGAFYFRDAGGHYLMYSGNCYENEKYFVGYAYAECDENDLRKVGFKKYPSDNEYSPLLFKNAVEEGTGHNSVIFDDGKYYIVYHARDTGNRKPYDTRTARACPFTADNGKITIERI